MGGITRRTTFGFAFLPLAAIGAGGTAYAQAGNWLVTSQEAALPLASSSKAGRAITRGPAIRQVSPAGAIKPNSPFSLRVEFVGRSGEKVDPASAQVTLLRGDTINITQRLKAYITANGIEIADAMVPPGTHVLQVAVSDARGRQTLANIEIEAR
jgi:hypothetical protein